MLPPPTTIHKYFYGLRTAMSFTLSQGYRFYLGEVVKMYFIENIPYTFDELPVIIQEHPDVQVEAMSYRDFDDEDLYRYSNYLIMEEMHPLMFDVPCVNPELLPQDE